MESLALQGVGGDVIQAFSQPRASSNIRSMRTDLLVATDSVTSAMSSLVKELNSGRNMCVECEFTSSGYLKWNYHKYETQSTNISGFIILLISIYLAGNF